MLGVMFIGTWIFVMASESVLWIYVIATGQRKERVKIIPDWVEKASYIVAGILVSIYIAIENEACKR